jgi:hypothetical protein
MRAGILTPPALLSTVRSMTDDRRSGIALIAGSLAGIITMALHPTGHDLTPAQFESVATMLIAVHGLALASLPVSFLGAWGMTRRIATADRIAVGALVVYAMALAAIMIAAVADGLVAPVVLRQMIAAAPSSREMWRLISNYNFLQNQGFAQLFVAASSVAIGLWSISIVRSRALPRGVAIYGSILTVITLLALFSGHLKLTTHGMGAVIVGQAIWFITMGLWLYRNEKSESAG